MISSLQNGIEHRLRLFSQNIFQCTFVQNLFNIQRFGSLFSSQFFVSKLEKDVCMVEGNEPTTYQSRGIHEKTTTTSVITWFELS